MLIIAFTLFSLTSCDTKPEYPKYHLTTITYIPDSLKAEYRVFIVETIRAASKQMTAGDYENVDETIQQAEYTAYHVFSVSVIGLSKIVSTDRSIELKPEEFNAREKAIFDELMHNK